MKIKRQLIGLVGKKGSGKTEVAKILREFEYMEIAFADKLKQVCSIMFDVPLQYFYEPEWKEKPVWKKISPRYMMQMVGTEVGRLIDQGVWVWHVDRFINERLNDVNIVIVDVRYENEAACVRRNHGLLWRIVRPGVGLKDNHSSEIIQDMICADHVLINGGTLVDLELQVKVLLMECERM